MRVVQATLMRAVALLVAAAPVASGQTPASGPTGASPEPAADGAPAWKQIFEDRQAVYLVDATAARQTGQFTVLSLLQYKVPQVVDGAQVWSVVSRMKLSCDGGRMLTLDNTFYALKMGQGPVVRSATVNDTWHQPQPDSLGGLIWNAACGKP